MLSYVIEGALRHQAAAAATHTELRARRVSGGRAPGRLTLIASSDGRHASVAVHQDVSMYSAVLWPGDAISHPLPPDRHAWVQIVRGRVELNGSTLAAGDGAAAVDESMLQLRASSRCEALLLDIA